MRIVNRLPPEITRAVLIAVVILGIGTFLVAACCGVLTFVAAVADALLERIP